MEISTVVGCRMACSYCAQAIHVRQYAAPHRPTTMPLETFKRCLAKVPKDVEIVFAGMAEPWLNHAATDMLLHVIEQGYAVSVYTTTVGMSVATADALRRIKFRSFCIHLPDSDGLMRLTVTDNYLAVLKAVMDAVPSHHYSVIGPLHPRVKEVVGREVNNDLPGICSRAGLVFPVPRKTGPLHCTACGPKLDHNVLLPSGDVVACCMQYDLKHIFGNLLTCSYNELFTSPEYQRMMRGLAGDMTVDLSCRTCELSAPRS